jgi:hypothetical protein
VYAITGLVEFRPRGGMIGDGAPNPGLSLIRYGDFDLCRDSAYALADRLATEGVPAAERRPHLAYQTLICVRVAGTWSDNFAYVAFP